MNQPVAIRGRPRKVDMSELKEEDLSEEIKIPKVVSWRKYQFWIRDRTTSNGTIIEARVITLNKTVQRQLAKAYLLDEAYEKKQFRKVLETGFKCCFCEKTWKVNKQLELVSIDTAPQWQGFNILCGKCWRIHV